MFGYGYGVNFFRQLLAAADGCGPMQQVCAMRRRFNIPYPDMVQQAGQAALLADFLKPVERFQMVEIDGLQAAGNHSTNDADNQCEVADTSDANWRWTAGGPDTPAIPGRRRAVPLIRPRLAATGRCQRQ